MVNANKETFEILEICGQTALFTCVRVDRETVPSDLHAYDLRDDGQGNMCKIEPSVEINHWGTIICKNPIKMNEHGYRSIDENDYSYVRGTMTLKEFQKGA